MQRTVFRDKDRCVGCYACIVACKLEHGLPPHPTAPPAAEPQGISLTDVYRYGPYREGDRVIQYFVPLSCMHCSDAPCIKACPARALHKDPETGATLVAKDRCIGCRMCLMVCPYSAPRYNEQGECELCDMCLQRFREGKRKTACEAVCIARAIYSGPADEVASHRASQVAAKLAEGAVSV